MYITNISINNIRLIKILSHELNTLGNGQLATINWVLDLFSWWMLFLKQNNKNIINYSEIKGIVIIDEIEKHLHLEWQENILKMLRNIFPITQFVSTTDSITLVDSKTNCLLISL